MDATLSIFQKHRGLGHIPYEKGQPWNLGAVDPHKTIYRGAAPANKGIHPRDSLRWLKARGVAHIMILNGNEQGIDRDAEIRLVRELGMQEHCFDWEQMLVEQKAGRDAIWQDILSLFRQGQLFLHCVWGVDRTGAITARARRELYGWNAMDAFLELRAYGFAFEFSPDRLLPYQKDVLGYFGFDLANYAPLTPGHPDHTACIVREQTKIG
jgi:hypothetical protein